MAALEKDYEEVGVDNAKGEDEGEESSICYNFILCCLGPIFFLFWKLSIVARTYQ